MGYKGERFHSPDPDLPRAAVMGGAVVASLTAWRDDWVFEKFRESQLDHLINCSDEKEYLRAKKKLMWKLHYFFLEPIDPEYDPDYEGKSAFSSGDVDVFLQPSPMTRSLMTKLSDEFKLGPQVRDHIRSFIGGSGFVQGDLRRASEEIYGPKREVCPGTSFVYALSEYALNGLLTNDLWSSCKIWPRPLHMIMLRENADLVGGLMDFDLSIVACAYDGNDVRITPRAAFSLITMAQVVTPFIIQEQRNWQRIVKYYKRGFAAYVVDPNCAHTKQCAQGPFSAQQGEDTAAAGRPDASDDESDEAEVTREAVYAHQREHGTNCFCINYTSPDLRELVIQKYHRFTPADLREFVTQKYHKSHRKGLPPGFKCLACDYACRSGHGGGDYSLALFEREEGEAMDFFADFFRWSDADRRTVESIHPWSRQCCKECRYRYEEYAFLKRNPGNADSLDNIFRDATFSRYTDRNMFAPRFYSGGVFDSTRHHDSAFIKPAALQALESQLLAEKTRHWIKHGEAAAYLPRFVFDEGTKLPVSSLCSHAASNMFLRFTCCPTRFN